MSEPRSPTIQELYQNLRIQNILAMENTKELYLKNFDILAQKLSEQIQLNTSLSLQIDKLSKKDETKNETKNYTKKE